MANFDWQGIAFDWITFCLNDFCVTFFKWLSYDSDGRAKYLCHDSGWIIWPLIHGRYFAAFPRFFAVDQNRISILLVYLYSIFAIDFIFLLGAYFAKTSVLVIYLVLWACIFLNSVAIYQQLSQDRVVLLDFVVPWCFIWVWATIEWNRLLSSFGCLRTAGAFLLSFHLFLKFV